MPVRMGAKKWKVYSIGGRKERAKASRPRILAKTVPQVVGFLSFLMSAHLDIVQYTYLSIE